MILRFRFMSQTDTLKHVCRMKKFRIQSALYAFTRNYQSPPTIFENEKKLMKKDNIPSTNRLIYRLHRTKLIIVVVSAMNFINVLLPSAGALIYLERNGFITSTTQDILKMIGESVYYIPDTECYLAIFTGLVVGSLIAKYFSCVPIRIYIDTNDQKYTGIFMNGMLPWRIKKHTFTTVKKSYKSFLLDNKRAVIHQEYFTRPHDYWEFIGEY